MLPVDLCVSLVLQSASFSPKVTGVAFKDLLGRVSAFDVRSPFPHPSCRTSIVDGYACKISSVGSGVALPVSDNKLFAGQASSSGDNDEHELDAQGCAYVATGARVPDCFDCVVPVEFAIVCSSGLVKFIDYRMPANANVRPVGCDIKQAELMVWKNQLITPNVMGLLATAGLTNLQVWDKITVGVMSSGDEVRK